MVNSPIEQNVQGKGGRNFMHSAKLIYCGFKGIYELVLMQKKSMSIADYRKKVEVFDAITDNKEPEEVESLVSEFFFVANGLKCAL